MKTLLNPIIFLITFISSFSIFSSTIYVDHKLTNNCNGNYSILNRNSSGNDGIAYNTVQEAADVSQPGDLIFIREGTYYNTTSTASKYPVLHILRSGIHDSPITYKNYNNETVILSGEDTNGNATKYNTICLGVKPSSKEDSSGQGVKNIIIEGLIIEGATKVGIGIYGPANKLASAKNPTENIVIRNVILRNNRSPLGSSGGGIGSMGKVVNVIIEYCESYNNTGNGISFGRIDKNWHHSEPEDDMSAAHDCVIRNCLIYNNIHPDRPGNTDGLGGSHMFNCTFENNISFGNSDDGMDIYASLLTTVNSNIIFSHSYTGGNNAGIKISAGGGGKHTVCANIVLNCDGFGIEGSRPSNPLVTYYPSNIYNNIVYNSGSVGLNTGSNYTPAPNYEKPFLRNNISLDNKSHDIDGSFDWINSDYNFIASSEDLSEFNKNGYDKNSLTGDPGFINKNITIDTNFSAEWTIEKKLTHIRNQIQTAFSLSENSQLINKGVVIDGYHNSIPGINSNENGKVWLGNAPDIGPFEYGYNPTGIIKRTKNKKNLLKFHHHDLGIMFTFFSNNATNGIIEIFDMKGRLIFKSTHKVKKGENNILWNGCPSNDQRLNNGFYFVNLKYCNKHLVDKLIFIQN